MFLNARSCAYHNHVSARARVGTPTDVRDGERGESLIEVVLAVAIFATALGALGAATIAATHHFGPDPIQSALESSIAREMRIAVDVLKYQGASIAPATLATTLPLSSGSPLPVTYTISSATNADESVTIVLSVVDGNDGTKRATLSQTIAAPAPLPGSRVAAPAYGNAPQ